jgi:hypothetical protein
MTAQVIVVHRVAAYQAWKKVFDAAASIRYAGGERDYQVLTSTEDSNLVVHTATWITTRAAKDFFESEELVRIRVEAGVEAPQFFYLDLVESGVSEPTDVSGR